MTTAVIGNPTGFGKGENFTIPVTISGGENGGALSAKAFSKANAFGMKLDEVEVIKGTSENELTVRSGRGTVVFRISALDSTKNRIYGGHITVGVFPKMDSVWTVETDGFDVADEITVYFKFTNNNA
jgi:hypothetical protein